MAWVEWSRCLCLLARTVSMQLKTQESTFLGRLVLWFPLKMMIYLSYPLYELYRVSELFESITLSSSPEIKTMILSVGMAATILFKFSSWMSNPAIVLTSHLNFAYIRGKRHPSMQPGTISGFILFTCSRAILFKLAQAESATITCGPPNFKALIAPILLPQSTTQYPKLYKYWVTAAA